MIAWKLRDNAPDIRAAGKVFPKEHGIEDCMVMPPEGVTPDLVKRVRSNLRPEVGQIWDTSCRTGDPPVNPDLSHGVTTTSSMKAQHLVNPERLTRFKQTDLNLREAIYDSKKTKPLGHTHDQAPGLPKDMDPLKTRFGRKTPKGESLKEIVTPQKSAKQVDEEFNEGRELYKKSHNDLDVGEAMDRNYDWSKFTKESLYGMETPHNNSGILVGTAMKWLQNDENGKVISKRLDDFREKTQPKMGEVHDPMADTLDVPPGHTFGVTVPIDKYGAGYLVHSEGPTTFSECLTLDEGALNTVRSHLKKQKFLNFNDLYAAFRSKDKEDTGLISAECVHDIAFHFRIPLTFEMLDMLIRWTTSKASGGVAYHGLLALMDWRMPLSEDDLYQIAQFRADQPHPQETTPDPATPPATSSEDTPSKLKVSTNYKTSSQAIRATVGELPTHGYRVYGVPTVRTDIPAPRLKRVSDKKNYGDESGTYGLMYPSVYSNHGVYEEDFFRPQAPEMIREIFEKIGVTMSDQVFEDLWKVAKERSPHGEVSVETFRMVAEEMNLAHASNPDKSNKK